MFHCIFLACELLQIYGGFAIGINHHRNDNCSRNCNLIAILAAVALITTPAMIPMFMNFTALFLDTGNAYLFIIVWAHDNLEMKSEYLSLIFKTWPTSGNATNQKASPGDGELANYKISFVAHIVQDEDFKGTSLTYRILTDASCHSHTAGEDETPPAGQPLPGLPGSEASQGQRRGNSCGWVLLVGAPNQHLLVGNQATN